MQGVGHYHLLIDKSLVDMYCTPDATLSLQNLQPGSHTITALPALTNHMDVEMNASSVTIDYEPAHPVPAVTAATFSGPPAIKIVSPAKGAQLSGAFDITVQVTNTQGFPSGKHVLIVYLADDQHAPLMPEVMDSVDVVFGS